MKKLLSLVGLLAISAPISLNVVVCNTIEPTPINEEKVPSSVSGFEYSKDFLKTVSPNEVYNKVEQGSFIKSKLIGDVLDVFVWTSFNLNKIIVDKNNSDKNNLINPGPIAEPSARLLKFSNHSVKLTISLKELSIITEAINSVKTYELEYVPKVTTVADLKAKIDDNFIKSQLAVNVQAIFVEDFILNQITNDQGVTLTNKDLAESGLISAKIKYYYGTFSDQTANLIIKSKAMLTQRYHIAAENTNSMI